MSEVVHKEGCWYPKALAEETAWWQRWPNACSRCGGYGGGMWYDRETGFQDYDPCPACLEDGHCPRCGGGVISETYWDAGLRAVCDSCGFIESATPGEPPPVEDPCSCMGHFDEYERWVPNGGPTPPPLDDWTPYQERISSE